MGFKGVESVVSFAKDLLKSSGLIMKLGHLNPPITPKQCVNSNDRFHLWTYLSPITATA